MVLKFIVVSKYQQKNNIEASKKLCTKFEFGDNISSENSFETYISLQLPTKIVFFSVHQRNLLCFLDETQQLFDLISYVVLIPW